MAGPFGAPGCRTLLDSCSAMHACQPRLPQSAACCAAPPAQVLRDLIAKHMGQALPEPPPRPAIRKCAPPHVGPCTPVLPLRCRRRLLGSPGLPALTLTTPQPCWLPSPHPPGTGVWISRTARRCWACCRSCTAGAASARSSPTSWRSTGSGEGGTSRTRAPLVWGGQDSQAHGRAAHSGRPPPGPVPTPAPLPLPPAPGPPYPPSWGLILYRHLLPASALERDGALDLGGPPHDYASVFVEGQLAGRLDRSQPSTNLTLPARAAGARRVGPRGGGGGGGGGNCAFCACRLRGSTSCMAPR